MLFLQVHTDREWVASEKIYTSPPPLADEINNNTITHLRTSYTNFRHFSDNSPPLLSGWQYFPWWVGYGSFLKQPNPY